MKLSSRYEFHFHENPRHVCIAFLRAVAQFPFKYFGFVVDKAKLLSSGFIDADTFYRHFCGEVFMCAKPYLTNANVKIDRRSNAVANRELASYLKKRVNDPEQSVVCIKTVKAVDSATNNLLQLADMLSGAIMRSFSADKNDAELYRKIIKHREISVLFWPE